MANRLKILLSSLFIVALPAAAAFANGPATVYKVTCSKFELYNGSSWITVFEGTSSELDIASVSGTGFVGNFMSGLVIPDGTYTQFRVTPSATFTFKGNDGANYTTATIGPGGGSVPTAVAADAAECTISVPGGITPNTEDMSATPIIVTDGVANHKVRVSFDVSTTIQTIGGELFPSPPSVTITIQ